MQKLKSLNLNDTKLPSPPAIAIRILDVVRKNEPSFQELARIISADPALTAKLLKVSNSAIYSLPNKINTIEMALSVLGVDVVKNIALSFVISKDLTGSSDSKFNFDLFWKRAVTAAVGAELLAKLLRIHSKDVFVCALLQDIGVLLMYLCRRDDFLRVLDEREASSEPLHLIEKKVFGLDHQEIGAELLEDWGLSEAIFQPIRFHHNLELAPKEYRALAQILGLSGMLASVYHGSRSAEKVQEIKTLLMEKHRIAEEQVDALIDEVAEKSIELLSSFEIDPGNMKPFSVLLQEANEELGRLNLSYEQLVMDLKQAKEKAEKLAGELKEANIRLRELANRDGLTELYNHRYFQDEMDRELSRSVRYQRSFSLMILDIDHFKKINDTYGHPGGDIVLKNISKLIPKLIRTSDMVARYGGEEFAIILPETELRGAMIFAERVRRAVEMMESLIEGKPVQISVSIGVTCYECTLKGVSKSAIIDAADKALYQSKNKGRNRVTMSALS